jgi:hypothetical protein
MIGSFLPRRLGLVALLVTLVLLGAGSARAEDSKKAQCAAAYEKSQELRAAGSLKAAHDMLVVCAQDFCPGFVQSDCAQWLTEVQRDLPTIVVVAKDKSGEDTTAVHVTMDGADFMKELDGKAVGLDPGPHAFRFELDGADPIEQQIVIRQGQKDRVIAVSFAPAASEAPGDSPYAGAKPEEGRATTATGAGPLRPYAYIAGGVGAAGIIGFAVLGGIGKGQESDLRKNCAPNCSRSDTDSIKTKYIVADVLLGVGIAGLGTGVALFFLSQPKKDQAPEAAGKLHFDVRGAPGAAFATVDGRF